MSAWAAAAAGRGAWLPGFVAPLQSPGATSPHSHPLPLPPLRLPPAVVVCAPTGAGKTAIAEAATLHYLAKGQRVIYTTPLKALSNQKLGEMRERFG